MSRCRVKKPACALAVAGILLLVLLCLPVRAPGATLTDGFVINALGSVEIVGPGVKAVAVQPWDGRIVIGGEFTITSGAPAVTWTNLARLNPDGTLDASFAPPAPDGAVRCLAVLQDPAAPGSRFIVAGGDFRHFGADARNGLARFDTSSGSLDAAFAPVTSPNPVVVNAVALLPDGKSMVAGGSFDEVVSGVASRNLARIPLVDPDPDAVAWGYAGGIDGEVKALLIGNGHLYVAGSFQAPLPQLARFTLAGLFDAAFPTGFITSWPGSEIRALALQADGMLLIGGEFRGAWWGIPITTRLARLKRDGSLDAGFDPRPTGAVNSIAVLPDGRIVIGGGFTAIGLPVPRNYVARLTLAGALDAGFEAQTDAAVNVVLRQGDGKLLVGGDFADAGGRPRSRLARFYPEGALDDNIAAANLQINNMVLTVGQLPDGSLTVGGMFTQLQGQARTRIARLTEQWNIDPDFNSALAFNNPVNALGPLPDGTLLVGGPFTAPQKLLLRVDAAGYFAADPAAGYNANLAAFMQSGVMQVVLPLRPGTRMPDDAPLEDGMVYVAGASALAPAPYKYLSRVTGSGTRDPSFNPWVLAAQVNAAAILPDNKLVVADQSGKVLRLDTRGDLDFNYTPVPLSSNVQSVIVERDASIIVSGAFAKDFSKDGVTWRRNILRYKKDGTIDDTFNVEANYGNINFTSTIARVAPQADGSMIIYGVFDSVKDSTGNVYPRDCIARIKPDGVLDQSFDLGLFTYHIFGSPINNILTAHLQPDGKVIVGGNFDAINGLPVAKLARAGNGVASEEIEVSPDGGKVTWRRSGTGAELWRVYFEKSDSLAGGWTYLGEGTPVDGGWELGGLNLMAPQPRTNRYVRARGYTAGDRGGSGSMLQSVRLYYLEPPKTQITVTAQAQRKNYGDPEPILPFTFAPALADGDAFTGSLWRPLGENVGNYPVFQGTLALNENYEINFVRGSLAIDPRGVTVTADNKEKIYGAADPELTYTFTPALIPPDAFSGSVTRAAGENVADGPFAIGKGSLALSGNYAVTFNGAQLTVKPAPLVITAENKTKQAGEPNPELTASFAGFIPPDTAASLGGDPSLSTTAALSSLKGSYPIVPSIGSITNGNYSYGFAEGILTVTGMMPQTITFPQPRAKTFGDGDFDPRATASSGFAVGYASATSSVAEVAAGRIRVAAPGTSVITASQPGDGEFWAAAPDVSRTLTVNPPPWNGLGFDGIDDAMLVGDAPQLNFGAAPGFTVEVWLRLDGAQPDGTGLVSKGEGGASWTGYQLMLQQGRLAAEIGTAAGAVGVAEGLVGTTPLDDGQWHHAALAVDRIGGSATLYFDGRVEAQVTNPLLQGSPDNAEPLRVGTDRGGTRFFRGDLDEIRLWQAARGRDDIRATVSQILDPALEPALAAYFHLDEGDVGFDNALFAKAPERTAYGADGTLPGFALSGATSNWIRSGAFLPLLETAPFSAVTESAAVGGGTVYPNYYPATDAGLCWGTAHAPTTAGTCSHSAGGTGSFAAAITGLVPGTTYYVRSFAVNAMGTAYGNELVVTPVKLRQAIAFTLDTRTYGDPDFPAGASSSSGLPVSYASSNEAVATVADGTVRIIGAGSTVITASQGGDGTYSAAPEVAITFTVLKAPLRVVADNKARAYLTPNPELTATYRGFVKGENGSVLTGAPLLATAATPASPAGNYDIVAGAGTLAAANYAFIPVNGTLTVLKSCQEIFFPAIPERTFGDPPFEIVASACSGLSLGFSSSNPSVVRVNGNVATITGAGSAVITASQQGSGNLEAAPEKSQTVIVHKSGQGITFSSLAQKIVGDPPFTLAAAATSGLPVSYASSDTSVATVSGAVVTVVGAGTTVITALQPGDGNFEAALPAAQPLVVAQEGIPPDLALSTLSSGAVTANPILNIVGTAADASGIASLTVNGADATAEASFFSSAVALTTGENAVVVAAADKAGNRTAVTLGITLDPLAPALAVDAPADNSVTNLPYFAASGWAAPGSAVTMWVNGELPQLLQVADGRFAAGGSLREGVNTVEFVSELSGRSSRVKRSVTLDTEGPAVAIVDPVEDLRSEHPTLSVRVGSDIGAGGTLLLDVDGVRYFPVLSGGLFEQEVPLPRLGATRITATATDGAGRTGVAARNVVRVERVTGDLGGDGKVGIDDALLLMRVSLGLVPLTPEILARGDVAPLVGGLPHPDEVIDVGDLLVLLRKIVGLVRFD